MAKETILYDLLLLLSKDADDDRRGACLPNIQAAIERGGGSVARNDDWGTRPLPYRIRHQREAEYHLMQFNAPPDLLEGLSHDLHITDGVLRFRIIKNLPGTPKAPDSPPPVVAQVAPDPVASES